MLHRESRHPKSLSPLRCHIVTPNAASEGAFWSHFGTRAMQSDLKWRGSRYSMSPYGPWTRSVAHQLCAVSRSLERCIEIRLQLECRPTCCLKSISMNISKDRETAHSWRATDRVQGPYGLKQHREPRHFKSLCMALVPKCDQNATSLAAFGVTM